MIGCSAYTREKWKRFDYLLKIQATMCKGIMTRKDWASKKYNYFDFYAGPGIYTADDHVDLDGEFGSPLRAIEILDRIFPDKELSYRPFFFEADQETAGRLMGAQWEFGPFGVDSITCEEAVDVLCGPQWFERTGCDPWKAFGLAFFDPNGVPDWTAVERFAWKKRFRHIDILINVNSSICKWVFTSRLHPETRRPTEHLKALGKKDVYLWEPTPGDSHQFALAYCTNGPFAEFRDWGFHRIESIDGRRIARRIDFSPAERALMGGTTGMLRGFDGGQDGEQDN